MVLRRLLETHEIGSQEALAALLEEAGHPVTQTTVSRDLGAVGAERSRGADGSVRYRLRGTEPVAPALAELTRMMQTFVVEIGHSGNLVVVRTPPGAANPVGAALDQAASRGAVAGVLGTIAGDDTLLVVSHDPRGGAALAETLEHIVEARA